MLKKNLLRLCLYSLVFAFVASISIDAAAQQVGYTYSSRTTEGDFILSESSTVEVTRINNRRTADEAVTLEYDYYMNWVTAGVGMGLVFLVGAVAGIGILGNDGDDGNGAGASLGTDTIDFRSPIRIGDDNDYNGTHDDNFQINTPLGITYSESFIVSSIFSKGTLKYTIAGAKESAKIYMNGSLVGRSCNPGNTAYAKRECDPINVTSQLRSGSNVLKIACAVDPYDKVTPYDDIEIYNMRLVLDQ